MYSTGQRKYMCDRLWINHPYAANVVYTVRGQICQQSFPARFLVYVVYHTYCTKPTFTQSLRPRRLFVFVREALTIA